MTTSWTLAAIEICTDALEHLGVLADGETATAGDMQVALRALDGVLKELPISGFCWPALSAETALTWGGVQSMALPSDYYAYPVTWRSDNGAKHKLVQIPHANWIAMPDRARSGDVVTHFYISPSGEFLVYPTPATDPQITLQYQKIISDAELSEPVNLPQYWNNPLGYGVANELVLKFDIPQTKRVDIAQRWAAKRAYALESAIASEVISFEVRE